MTVGRTFNLITGAKYLGLHRNTIQKAAHEGILLGHKNRMQRGTPWVFTKEQLDAYRAYQLR